MLWRSRILGVGAYLPERCVSNDELAKTVDTTDEWVVERTGIRTRHIAAENELTSDLAIAAAKQALLAAGVDASEIDVIVLATTTPDDTFPATATKVQHGLGLTTGFAFDVQAVCSGFIYALAVADNFIRLGQARRALVIGAETFTRLLDWTDRTTCVLFGDGAGAVVLGAEPTESHVGILSTHLHSDGRYFDMLYVDGGPSRGQRVGHVRMQGSDVFKHAVNNLARVVEETLSAHQLSPDAIDWLIPHQANKRIIDATAKKLHMTDARVILTVQKHGNTSAASVPLALAEGIKDGRIKPGQLLLLEAMGGGFTWGAALVRY